MKLQGFHPDFIKYLEKFRFTRNIYSTREGDIVFPVSPVLQVEAKIIEAQIIETILLNILNFQTLIATKASRMRHAAAGCTLIDFGLRRAQGPGGYYASRAAFIGGFNSTSNVIAGREYGIPVSGTMAHSYIESYDDELTAFRNYADVHPFDSVLLVDTYDTLNSGLPNAVKVAKEMEMKGHRLSGVRLDSGDLAYLARRSREILDNAGLHYVKIAASNQLDENIIKSLLEQHAPIDVFGVGTSLITGHPDASLDGVYKLALSNGKPRIKLSDNVNKFTLPHRKQVFRMMDNTGYFAGADAVSLADEQDVEIMHHPLFPLKSLSTKTYIKEPLLQKVMSDGKRLNKLLSLAEIAGYTRDRLKRLQKNSDIVLATQDWHPQAHKSFASNHPGKNPFEKIDLHGIEQILWPDHCVQGTAGAGFHPALETNKIAAIFRKGMDPETDSYSGFYDNGHQISTGLSGYLREKGITEIFFCGLAADICVYYTILDALNEGFEATLIEDASSPLDISTFSDKKTRLRKNGVSILNSGHML